MLTQLSFHLFNLISISQQVKEYFFLGRRSWFLLKLIMNIKNYLCEFSISNLIELILGDHEIINFNT